MLIEEISEGKNVPGNSVADKVANLRELVQMAIFATENRQKLMKLYKDFVKENGVKLIKLYQKIEQDPRCNKILLDSNLRGKDMNIVKHYNEHVRASGISDRVKEYLII